MTSAAPTLPPNCPVRDFKPASPERGKLEHELAKQRAAYRDISPIVDGEAVGEGSAIEIFEPHAKNRHLGSYCPAEAELADRAIASAMNARHEWSRKTLEERAAVFLKAADILEGDFGYELLAATMLGQSKTAYQAEIDASAELVDFLRLNVAFAMGLQEWQPRSTDNESNSLELRALDGFVFAASPFNFTAIAGNLSIAPALMGNTVVWMPSERSIYSGSYLMDLFEQAGLPPGVINFIPTNDPASIGNTVLNHRDLCGVHFTGSTATFDRIWQQIGQNLSTYRSYPRIVGETGGKDFVFAHPSANRDALVTALVRGAFDYQGQKCSAASRAYIPQSIYAEVRDRIVEIADTLAYGDVTRFENFMGAVIDKRAYDGISGFINQAESGREKVLTPRRPNDDEGWFVPPTVVECDDPGAPVMTQEIFGPVLALHAFPDEHMSAIIDLVDNSTPYALTGAIFAEDEQAIVRLSDDLRDAAGNFYINDKPTGAVVGRQPFGGGRRSGTNDKAGSPFNLMRWTSPRTVKRNHAPDTDHRYPHMAAQ